jgi:hypothetical protein
MSTWAYKAFLEAQFKKHPKSIGAVIIFGTDLPMGAITRSPPYLGSTIIEVGMSTAETDSSLDSGSPVNIIPATHAMRGCSLYSELYWIRTLGFSLLECSDSEHLPAWTQFHPAKFASGNRFLFKRTADGYVALEHTPAGDKKYTGMYSISPQHPNYDLFRRAGVSYETCDSTDKLPCQTVSLDRERAFYAATSTDACRGSVSVSSVLFPAVDYPAGSRASVLQQLAAETAEEHCAGADELSLAALVLDKSSHQSVTFLFS